MVAKLKTSRSFLRSYVKKNRLKLIMADRIASNYISDSLADQLTFSVPKAMLDQELQTSSSEDTQDKEQKVKKAQAHIRYVLQIKRLLKIRKLRFLERKWSSILSR